MVLDKKKFIVQTQIQCMRKAQSFESVNTFFRYSSETFHPLEKESFCLAENDHKKHWE